MTPDLDGFPILFGDMDLYAKVHHELFHAPIYGVLLGLILMFPLQKYFGLRKRDSFIVIAGSFLLHGITDVVFTDWPVKLLWPLSSYQFTLPQFAIYDGIFSALVYLAAVIYLGLLIFKEKKKRQKSRKTGR